jgi:Beta/Gamma crystallin
LIAARRSLGFDAPVAERHLIKASADMKFQAQKLAILASACLLAVAASGQRAAAQPYSGCSATVYWDANFAGEKWTLHDSVSYVGPHWNDKISSIAVHRGVWVFYWDGDYKGEELRLGPGKYDYVGDHWNDQISSARCVEPGDVAVPDDVMEEVVPQEGEYIGTGGHLRGHPHDRPRPRHIGPRQPHPHGPPRPHGPSHQAPHRSPPPKHHR